MKIFNNISKRTSVALVAVVLGLGLAGSIVFATLAPGAVDLGTADSFAILSGSGITDASTLSLIDGNVGTHPITGAAITGLSCTQLTLTSTLYDNDGAYTGGFDANTACRITAPVLLTTAKADLLAAYTDASTRATTSTIPTDLAAQTLTPGVYDAASGTFTISAAGTLTLDGGGNPDAVFIFKTATTLVTGGASSVVLTNGAQACNVFWAIGTSATLDDTDFVGTILAATSIGDAGDSTVLGRLLADANDDGTGAVTLINTDVTVPTCAPSLTLLKTVTNDNGGTALDTAWTLTATGTGGSPTNLSGTTPVDSNVTFSDASFQADTYTLAESGGPSGYTASTYSCVINGGAPVISNSVTLAAGDDAVCTITNDDQAPSLTLDKIVVNNNSGSSAESAWTVTATGPTSISGPGAAGSTDVASDATFDAGTYTLSESAGPSGYTASSWSCTNGITVNGSNEITLGLGDTTVCTITNDDIAPSGGGGGGGGSSSGGGVIRRPLINIVKVPSQLIPFQFGGGDVTYTYTVTNPGLVAMHDVVVTDDKCGPVSRISGDTDNDNLLDTREVWTYSCRMNVPVSTRNIATTKGEANGFTVWGYAFANVFVSVPGLPKTGYPPQVF